MEIPKDAKVFLTVSKDGDEEYFATNNLEMRERGQERLKR